MQTLEKTPTAFLKLKTLLAEINDIQCAVAVLHWDEATYMPAKGAAARGRQIATLRQIAHAKFTDGTIAHLLEELESYAADLPYDSDAASLLRVTRRSCDRASKISSDFTVRFSQLRSEAYQAWAKARPENNFALVQPYLERIVDYSRELANFFPGYHHIADPLIEFSDYGMSAASIRAVFAELREQ